MGYVHDEMGFDRARRLNVTIAFTSPKLAIRRIQGGKINHNEASPRVKAAELLQALVLLGLLEYQDCEQEKRRRNEPPKEKVIILWHFGLYRCRVESDALVIN